MLLTVHNLHYPARPDSQAREAIERGCYGAFLGRWRASPAADDY